MVQDAEDERLKQTQTHKNRKDTIQFCYIDHHPKETVCRA